MSMRYIKKYYASLEYVPGIDGYSYKTPHELVLEDANGAERVVRVAGPTLVWVHAQLESPSASKGSRRPKPSNWRAATS